MSFEVTKLIGKWNNYSEDTFIPSIIGGLKSHSIENNDNSMKFFKIVKKPFVKYARKKINTNIDFTFLNEGLQSSRYIIGIFNTLDQNILSL